MARPWITAPLLLALAGMSPVRAAPPAGAPPTSTVSGIVVRPPRVPPPESRHLGFLPPLENPIVELRQYDPLPECFVFLEGGPAAPDAAEPTRGGRVWMLQSHSFEKPILPVVSGTTVEISNEGRETHVLAAPDREDLLPRDPIGPHGSKTLVAAGPGQAIRVISRTMPHVEGRVVPLPTRYFGEIERSGRFRIDGVPSGRWNVKVWYRDGWLALPPRTIDVPARELRIDLTSEAFGK